MIKTAAQDKPAKTLTLIAYAPGCQFVTISVDDLSVNTGQFYGKADVSALAEKALQVGREISSACKASVFAGQDRKSISTDRSP